MQHYGNDYYVSTMTVLFSIEQLLRLPVDGLCQGAVPIMSYNYGAGKPERVRKTYFLILAFSFAFTSLCSWLICFSLRCSSSPSPTLPGLWTSPPTPPGYISRA
ncbi:MAG: MATE family efflux transporter [Bilophila sp.]